MSARPNPNADREADELVLRCLELRAEGWTPQMIASAVDRRIQYVSVAMNRVADADMDHEPAAADAYPWRLSPRKHGPRRAA